MDVAMRVPGGPDGLADDLREGRSRIVDGRALCEDPARPRAIPFGRWRRMSRLTRLAACAVLDLREAHDEVPGGWDQVPLVWGSAMGEVVPSSDFLDRMFREGPQAGSPLAFQNSVYIAPPAHLSITFGLRGPIEAVSAGAATGLAALARAADLLVDHPAVLLVVGDDDNRTTSLAWKRSGEPVGEGVIAVLLGRGEDLMARWGVFPGPGPTIGRGTSMPYETGFESLDAAIRPERTLGMHPAGELVALMVLREGSAIAKDGGTAVSAWWV